MSDPLPPEHGGTLGRLMPCPNCGHDEHLLPCGVEIVARILCRCRDVPVPGVYPEVAP